MFGGVGQQGTEAAGEKIKTGLVEGSVTVSNALRVMSKEHGEAVDRLGLRGVEAAAILGQSHRKAVDELVRYGGEVLREANAFTDRLKPQIENAVEQMGMLAAAHQTIGHSFQDATTAFKEAVSRADEQADRGLNLMNKAITDFDNNLKNAVNQFASSTKIFEASVRSLAYNILLGHLMQVVALLLIVAVIAFSSQAHTSQQRFFDVISSFVHDVRSFAISWLSPIAFLLSTGYLYNAQSVLEVKLTSLLQLERGLTQKALELQANLQREERVMSQQLDELSYNQKLGALGSPANAAPQPPQVLTPVPRFDGFSFYAENVTLYKDRERMVFGAGSNHLHLSSFVPRGPDSRSGFLVPNGKTGAWSLTVWGKIKHLHDVGLAIRYECWLRVEHANGSEDAESSLGGGVVFTSDTGLPRLGCLLVLHAGDTVSVELHLDNFNKNPVLWHFAFQGEFRGVVE